MRQHSRAIVASVLAAVAIPLLYSQAKPANTADDPAVFRADTRLVVLHATVIDKSGRLITNLQQKAFKVFENKVEQPIKKVLREDVPVSMGLIVDNSGSMRTKRAKVEAAALSLVRASNPEDEVFIVNFNDEAYLEEPGFTSDIKLLERGLSKLDSRGGTAMRDAIRMSMDYLKENGKKDKKLLVVVTDGEDNYSNVTLENLVRDLQRTETPIQVYTIGLLSEEERREAKKAERALIAIADASGGASYIPKENNDIEKICQQVAKDIRSQYIIEYNPVMSELDGSFRSIKVLATAPNGPKVRTRSGYYATPEKGSSPTAGASAKK